MKTMDSDMIILDITDKMDKTIENLGKRFATVRAGRANPSSLDGVNVDYYGSMTPLKQLATISVPEARQLLIKPFDKSSLGAIEKAILAANLGYNPGNDGETIRIVIPELTEERRKELVKQVKTIAEDAKVSIRNIRRDGLEDVKKAELPEDESKGMEKDIQDLVNEYNKKIENELKEKEQELLTV
jgi:ribosome recycling factor